MDILIVLDHEDKKKLQKDIEKILVANMQYNFQIYVICNSADLLEVANRYSDKIEILRSCDTAAAIAYLADRVSYDLMLVCTDKSMFNKQKVLKAVALFEKKKKQVEKVEDNVPLVSICIYNYNYGRYLAQCIQSVLDQSYTNIELCISDNDSTDDSWSIICNFAERYPDKLKIIKNSSNKGAGYNKESVELWAVGKYILFLTSDDYMRSDFVERCVNALENNSDCSFVMVHRDIVDSEDNVHSEAPFYNKTCIIPGFAQASVYMVAAINPSISQIMYKRETIKDFAIGGGALNVRWFGARLQDFELCCKYSIIYIHEPLLINRVHAGSDGSSIDKSLIQCVGQYLLVHQFRDLANAYGNEMAALRLEEAKTKVAFLCLRYSVRFLLAGNESVAKQYYYLSRALSESVAEDEVYKQISRYYDCDNATKRELLVSFSEIPNLHVRGNSYDPPVGSVEIDV